MAVEAFTKRTNKRKRKRKRDRSLDAEKNTVCGGWGTGDQCPALQMAGLQGRTFCWTQLCLRRQLVHIPADIRAVGEPKGRHSREHSLPPSSSLWSWVKSCPRREKWEKWPNSKFFLLGLLHPPPLPPQRILTTCTSDVRAIPPPIVNGMPCFRSMIRAASWGCGTTTLFSRAQRPKPLSPSSPSRERAVAVVSGPGADGRLPAAGHAVGLCILFQKSSRAATATVAMPKGAHLTIGCYDHQQRTKRATRLRGAHRARLKPRLATVASLQHVSTILSLALNSWGSGSISMTLRQNPRSPLWTRRRMLR